MRSCCSLARVSLPVLGTLVVGTTAVASTPPDTGFLRSQAELAFTEEHPEALQVACAPPDADEPGVQFFCYGSLPDGVVLVEEATLNEDGGVELAPVGDPVDPGATTTTTVPTPFEGTGNLLVRVPTITQPTIVSVTHDGESLTLQPQQGGASIGPLITATATPTGRWLVGLDGTVSALAVSADGRWEISVEPVTSATPLHPTTGASGSGPDVVGYADTEEVAVAIAYEGSGPLRLIAHTAAGETRLLEQEGSFTGPAVLPPGPGFVEVDAPGDWTLELEPPATEASAVG